MILFFGPAGSGKSVQGQKLAENHGWRWISAGKLLRASNDPEIAKTINEGKLIDQVKMSEIMGQEIKKSKDIEHLILDGFPRQVEQTRWLIENAPHHERSISLAIILDIPAEEIKKRLLARGRPDDEPDAIEKRLRIYKEKMNPMVEYMNEKNIPTAHIDGVGTIDQVQDRIEEALKDHLN